MTEDINRLDDLQNSQSIGLSCFWHTKRKTINKFKTNRKMTYVKPKKHLGQHFLKDTSIAERIVNSMTLHEKLDKPNRCSCIEVGAGTGVLTNFLCKKPEYDLWIVEIDSESINYLHKNYPSLSPQILSEDFLAYDLQTFCAEHGEIALIGNFPYNISSQIMFKVYENYQVVGQVVGMFQKEVAERITAAPGSKKYGIPSVLLQAYYDVEYLFTVNEDVFVPPPKVKSGVIRLTRKEITKIPCNERRFKVVVKTAFNQRRKTLRNSLKALITKDLSLSEPELFAKRPEQLSVEEFFKLTNLVDSVQNSI